MQLYSMFHAAGGRRIDLPPHEPALCEAPGAPIARSADTATPANAALCQSAIAIQSIGRALAHCRRFQQPLAVLSVGVVRVGTLNDPLAEPAGQPAAGREAAVSLELGHRLHARTRAKDSVVRLAALEYAVLLPGCRPEGAAGACKRLALALGGVYALGGEMIATQVAVGLASWSRDTDSATALWEAVESARARSGQAP